MSVLGCEVRLPGLVVFGPGVASQAGRRAAALVAGPRRRALVVTDAGVAAAGLHRRVVEALEAEGVEVCLQDSLAREPEVGDADGCGEEARRRGCGLVLGLGGGSALDVAKGAAVVAAHGGSVASFAGKDKVPGPGLPTMLLPTTGGTGAEATMNAVFADPQTHAKLAVISPHLLPSVALVDPELATSCPPGVTAATGADALAHGVEAYGSKNANPFSDLFALEAVRLAGLWLRRAVHHGADLEARAGMARAAFLAGAALQVGAGAVHGLAYPLSGRFGFSHGLANALLLAPVMEFNAPAHPARYARLAAALGERVEGLAEREAALLAPRAVRALLADVGLPSGLKAAGVPPDSLEALAAEGITMRRNLDNNPRLLVRAEEALAVYRAAYGE